MQAFSFNNNIRGDTGQRTRLGVDAVVVEMEEGFECLVE